MRFLNYFLPLLLLAEVKPPQTNIVRQWLPMTVGDCWVYETEIFSGDHKNPHVERWQQADTISSVHHIAEGILIKRRVAFIKGAVPPEFVHNPSESNILVHDNCIYFVNEINTAFRQALATHKTLPDVCFPLEANSTWGGDPHQGQSVWSVRGRGRKEAADPMSATAHSWRLEASLTPGDTNYVWFQRNVGVTARRTRRSGSYYDYRVRLVSFQAEKSHP